uniref:Uncharacterized protein n=1 Tax=Rhizophora mucronata TaxID=61149 RepID=A0A2P2NR85_RHIMU
MESFLLGVVLNSKYTTFSEAKSSTTSFVILATVL